MLGRAACAQISNISWIDGPEISTKNGSWGCIGFVVMKRLCRGSIEHGGLVLYNGLVLCSVCSKAGHPMSSLATVLVSGVIWV